MPRGRLRIYLGAAPGVGKTVAMLDEGHRRRERGTDVVVGVCDTHERAYTAAMLRDLERVPLREVAYRGSTLRELDLDAVLARAPQVALVDELAHTNAPGSRHRKRWEDVESLLAAGIDVISTVNVQHLESLNDVVEAITGIRQQETVPDRVVRSADQIELVDMSPHALRRRLAHGNVYAADTVDAALANYFREGNLTALRELSLLWLADRVDEGLEAYRAAHGIDEPWPTRERVVVALTGGPEGATLLRRGAQVAARGSGGELVAVHVTASDGLVDANLERLTALRELTTELGGTFHMVSGGDVAASILDVARAVNARQVILGASRRAPWRRMLRRSVDDEVVARSGDIDVVLVTHEEAAGPSRQGGERRGLVRPWRWSRPQTAVDPRPSRRRLVGSWLLATLGTALLTLVLSATRNLQDLPLEVLLFLALTVLTALVGGFGPALVSALLGSLCLNWFLTPPLHTLSISDPQNAVAVVVFVVVALGVGSAVHLSDRRAAAARAAQREAQLLADAAQTLLGEVAPLPALLGGTVKAFGMDAAGVVRRATSRDPWQVVCATEDFDADHVDDSSVRAPVGRDAVLVLQGPVVSAADRRLVSAFAAHAEAILRREELAAQAGAAGRLARDNRSRTALLAAVSHDLRTPLAGIKAAVSTLREPDLAITADDRADLLETIEESTDRLSSLVANLLDMSRLQSGSVPVHPGPVRLPDVMESALVGLSGSVEMRLDLPPDLPPVTTDAGLLERVVANLVENATRYGAGSTVVVQASTLPDRLQLRIIDRGPGVPEEQKDAIFAPFQRIGDVPVGDGVGLGLAVCRGLLDALGGSIVAEDTPGGGLTMVVELPLDGRDHPPTVPPLEPSAGTQPESSAGTQPEPPPEPQAGRSPEPPPG
ncbi:DUF4118 domain-containing protein, partial [Nostocoides japonicum]|uniref:DUF4118 domain-containing protein n=1 Tax=Nostocoides japonicum TaxID=99481 RepID=UPI0009FAEDCE